MLKLVTSRSVNYGSRLEFRSDRVTPPHDPTPCCCWTWRLHFCKKVRYGLASPPPPPPPLQPYSWCPRDVLTCSDVALRLRRMGGEMRGCGVLSRAASRAIFLRQLHDRLLQRQLKSQGWQLLSSLVDYSWRVTTKSALIDNTWEMYIQMNSVKVFSNMRAKQMVSWSTNQQVKRWLL